MARYSKKAEDKIHKVMKERKEGTLRSGGSGKKVTSRKQAIAIGISEARAAGAKVPPPPKKRGANNTSARKRTASRKTTSRKPTARKTTARKGVARKRAASKRR